MDDYRNENIEPTLITLKDKTYFIDILNHSDKTFTYTYNTNKPLKKFEKTNSEIHNLEFCKSNTKTGDDENFNIK